MAIGFTIGLLQLSIALAVTLIGTEAFVASQVGLRVGARLGEVIRERVERLAAVALVVLEILIHAEAVAA